MRLPLSLVLLGAGACDGAATTSDAAVPVDASPRPDAFACSLVPSDSPGPPVGGPPSTDFDIALPHAGTLAVLVGEDELLVFSMSGVDHVSLDGELGAYAPFADVGTRTVTLEQVVRGDGGFGAIVHLHDATTDERDLCTLDAAGAMDASRCAILTEGTDGPLAFDGTSYQRYVAVDGRLERHTYDDLAALVATADLSPGDFPTASVIGAVVTAAAEHVLTVDTLEGACAGRVREHVIDPAGGHQVRELFAPDVGPVPTARPLIAADDAGDVSVLAFGACLVDGCETAPETGAMLTTYEGGVRTLDAAPVSVGRGALIRDGGRTVALTSRQYCYERGDPFSCDGLVEVTRYLTGASLSPTPRLATPSWSRDASAYVRVALIAPGDYAIAYARDAFDPRLTRTRP